jgi:hypothetical protein
MFLFDRVVWLQEEQDEHGQGKWEGKLKGKSDSSIELSMLVFRNLIYCSYSVIHVTHVRSFYSLFVYLASLFLCMRLLCILAVLIICAYLALFSFIHSFSLPMVALLGFFLSSPPPGND